MKKITYFTAGILCFILALGTLFGEVQKIIKFRDPMNEIVFFGIALIMAIVCIFSVFDKR
jgi:hypothetical protein